MSLRANGSEPAPATEPRGVVSAQAIGGSAPGGAIGANSNEAGANGNEAAGAEPRAAGAEPRAAGAEPRAAGAKLAGSLQYATFLLAGDEIPDLLALAAAGGRRLLWRNEMCLLAVGEAVRLPLGPAWASAAGTAGVREALASIRPAKPARTSGDGVAQEAGAQPGRGWPTGPVALGALPYDPARAGHLSVPELLLGRRRDLAWVTVVAEEASALDFGNVRQKLLGLRTPEAGSPAPDHFSLVPSMAHQQWKQLVARTVAEVEAGRLAKVVLARRVEVRANRPFPLEEALRRLAALYPSCAVFRVEDFIGASPETLIRRDGLAISSHPLAGTVARSGDQATDDSMLASLLGSAKHRREHQLVVDAIATKLGPLCTRLDVPSQPSVISLRNVSHLASELAGTLGSDGQLPTALELAALLQPTPAVGGDPTGSALSWQRAHEGFDRGRYAGPVGWVDAQGDGEWVLGLRCACVRGSRAYLYAGNGIVAGSDPEAELVETQLKLQALLAALVRP